MALVTKIKYNCTDKTGRIINIKDNTGLYNINYNQTGYGGPNTPISDVEKIKITLSKYKQKVIGEVNFSRSSSDGEYVLTYPTVDDICNGDNIELTSILLGISTPEEGLKTFSDGVYDVTMYTTLSNRLGISVAVTKGSREILGSGLNILFRDYTHVSIDNIIYAIDKKIGTNGGSRLFLIDPILSPTGSYIVAPVLFSNTKAYNDANSSCGISEASKGFIFDSCKCKCNTEEDFFKLLMYKEVSEINFKVGNYEKSEELLCATERVLDSIKCKKKC